MPPFTMPAMMTMPQFNPSLGYTAPPGGFTLPPGEHSFAPPLVNIPEKTCSPAGEYISVLKRIHSAPW